MRLTELTKPIPRRNIINALDGFSDFITSTKRTPEEITKFLDTAMFNAGFDIEIDHDFVDGVDPGQMNMNAWYDPESDSDQETPIGVTLLFSSNETNPKMSFNKGGAKMFTIRFADAVVHELIHADQHRKRGYMKRFKGKSFTDNEQLSQTQQYLSRPDEIEAYAHNIASELLRNLDKETAYQYMRSFGKAAHIRDKLGNLLSDNLFSILVAFEFDTSNPVIKSLTKRVIKYLDILDNE